MKPKTPTETGGVASERRPLLVIAVGRQRVGKTSLLNTTAQFLRAHGAQFSLWNADTLNKTYSLSRFHTDVLEPPSPDPEDVKAWLEDRFTGLIRMRGDALLDIGGGDTPLARLVHEVPLVQTLDRRGVRLVLVHVIGPEMADLDYLERFLSDRLLAPEATLIVMNKGLVLTGRSSGFAFSAVRQHPAMKIAMDAGAELALMPSLPCMSRVTDRALTFADAMSGGEKPGHEPLSFFDQERVAVWWTRELPAFFAEIPRLWLPDMPGFVPPPAAEAQGPTDATAGAPMTAAADA